jgi:hypothetical protein
VFEGELLVGAHLPLMLIIEPLGLDPWP